MGLQKKKKKGGREKNPLWRKKKKVGFYCDFCRTKMREKAEDPFYALGRRKKKKKRSGAPDAIEDPGRCADGSPIKKKKGKGEAPGQFYEGKGKKEGEGVRFVLVGRAATPRGAALGKRGKRGVGCCYIIARKKTARLCSSLRGEREGRESAPSGRKGKKKKGGGGAHSLRWGET